MFLVIKSIALDSFNQRTLNTQNKLHQLVAILFIYTCNQLHSIPSSPFSNRNEQGIPILLFTNPHTYIPLVSFSTELNIAYVSPFPTHRLSQTS